MIILASASPRRQELLRNAGIPFTVQPADIDESLRAGESPLEYTKRLGQEKALKVFQFRPNDIVLAADTTVVVDQEILGKPRDHDDAARMLRLLSGRTHQVITGVCLMGPRQEAQIHSETTLVTMSTISDEEIRAYVATGDPMDKAGAYGIQGVASRWIPRIEGDYSNVVGLPVARVYRMLRDYGVV